jgi:uridine kinase
MVPDTSYLSQFDLFRYKEGLVLQFIDLKKPHKIATFEPDSMLYQTLKDSTEWAHLMEVDTVGELNDLISRGEMREMILVQEALMEKKIGKIADHIMEDIAHKKFVFIGGPSSSGKTTFAHRLSIQLRSQGLKPKPISVDNYFVNRENTPKDAEGNYDFECLEALDVEQFNKDMSDLLAGKEVQMPTFDFIVGERQYKGNTMKLGDRDILVVEGIHGLNPKLSKAIPEENKYKVYISALTQLNVDNHNRVPTTDARLLRRIVRDSQYRGATATRTIGMWPSVRRGEELYIFPFQEEADTMFNSSLIYELSVLKQYAEPLLFNVAKESAEYLEAKRLIKFLDYFLGVTTETIPNNSLIREFIGGSSFR